MGLFAACLLGACSQATDVIGQRTIATPVCRTPGSGAIRVRLDPTFGQAGVLVFDVDGAENTTEYARRPHAIDSAGRHLVTGSTIGPETIVVRVKPNGEGLDETYGEGGVARLSLSAPSSGTAILAADFGRSYVASKMQAGSPRTLTALDGTGRPLTTFGSSGTAFLPGDTDVADELVRFQPSGDLGMVGQRLFGGNEGWDLSVTRFDPNTGQVVTAWGLGGVARTSMGGDEFGAAFAWAAGGGFYLAGDATSGDTSLMAAVKLDNAGVVMPSFGDAGHVTTNGAGTAASALAALELDGGELLVGGGYQPGSDVDDTDVLVAAYDASGKPDSGFGTNGIFSVAHPGADYIHALVPFGSEHVLLIGRWTNGTDEDAFVGLLTRSGNLVSSFGNGGIFTIDFGSPLDLAVQGTFDNEGRLVIAGAARQGTAGADFALARLIISCE
jgi:hypothetical protein